MKITLESEFETGNKIEFHDGFQWVRGVVIEERWDEATREFQYLVELENRERLWQDENSIIPRKEATE